MSIKPQEHLDIFRRVWSDRCPLKHNPPDLSAVQFDSVYIPLKTSNNSIVIKIPENFSIWSLESLVYQTDLSGAIANLQYLVNGQELVQFDGDLNQMFERLYKTDQVPSAKRFKPAQPDVAEVETNLHLTRQVGHLWYQINPLFPDSHILISFKQGVLPDDTLIHAKLSVSERMLLPLSCHMIYCAPKLCRGDMFFHVDSHSLRASCVLIKEPFSLVGGSDFTVTCKFSATVVFRSNYSELIANRQRLNLPNMWLVIPLTISGMPNIYYENSDKWKTPCNEDWSNFPAEQANTLLYLPGDRLTVTFDTVVPEEYQPQCYTLSYNSMVYQVGGFFSCGIFPQYSF